MMRAVICASLTALLLAACSSVQTGSDVVAQAQPDGRISFDVVNIDDAVLATLAAQRQPAFAERFKKYTPPPALKIGAGDIVSVVIFEATGDGLFGNSLTEVSLPPGAVARKLLSPATPPSGNAVATVQELGPSLGLSAELSGLAEEENLTPSLDLAGAVFGGASGQTAEGAGGQLPASVVQTLAPLLAAGASAQGGLAGIAAQQGLAPGTLPPGTEPEQAAAEGAADRSLEALLEAAVQSGRPGTLIPEQQVGSDGAISIPYAGRILAAGHTPAEVQHAIEQRLAGKAIDPQVVVIVNRNLANSVSVAGEMVRGARVPLSPGGDRLLQVIAAAGGPEAVTGNAAQNEEPKLIPAAAGAAAEDLAKQANKSGLQAPVHDIYVALSRGGITATIPYSTLVADPDQDIYAEPGDVLTLVRRPKTFSVFGAAGKNTAINFGAEKLSLSEALAKAGGLLDDRADPSAVFLFRYEPLNVVRALGQPVATNAPPGLSPIVYRLDLREAKSYLLARKFPVHDKDIIFVADAESRKLYQFILLMSQIVGPVESGLVTCANTSC